MKLKSFKQLPAKQPTRGEDGALLERILRGEPLVGPDKPDKPDNHVIAYYKRLRIQHGSVAGIERRILRLRRQMDDNKREQDDLVAAMSYFLRQ